MIQHTRPRRIMSMLILWGLVLLLWGCGGNNDGQLITFGDYVMTIDERFVALDPSRIENTKSVWSIIEAYTFPAPTPERFEKNIVVARLWLLGEDTLWRYAGDLIKSIKKTFGGYQELLITDQRYRCNRKRFDGIIHAFSFKEWLFEDEPVVHYMLHYYFIDSMSDDNVEQVYVIAAATDIQDELEILREYTDTLDCVDLTQEE